MRVMWIVVGIVEWSVEGFFCGWRAMKAAQNPTNSISILNFFHNSKNKNRSSSINPNPTLTKTSPNRLTYISNHFFKFYTIHMKEYIIKSWKLLQDAMNPDNAFGIRLATDDLFHRIEIDQMNSLEDYISFKEEWYPQLKNKAF